MTNAIDNARKALDAIHRYSFGSDEFSRNTIRSQVEIVWGLLDPLEYEYRVVTHEGEQHGPITSLADAESGRWSSGHDGDIIQKRTARGKWEKVS